MRNFRESQLQIARRYRSLPAVRFVYLDGLRDCRFTYEIIVAFDRKVKRRYNNYNNTALKTKSSPLQVMTPDSVRGYNQWASLNRLYGVVDVSYAYADDLRAVLEFEPGLYTHHQMRAIRDEYLKLPGTKFGWVSGRRAKEVTTIVLHFSRQYLKRVPMRKYRLWDALNRRYSTNITILEESKNRAFVRFPEGKYSDLELKSILRKYRKLPGIVGVRMDKLDLAGDPSSSTVTNATLGLPPQRSLRSWMRLSNARSANIMLDGDENHSDWHRVRHSGNIWDTSPCINDA